MRVITLLLLLCTMSAHPVAAQGLGDLAPIQRFAVLEASRLTASRQEPAGSDLSRVVATGTGKLLAITDREGQVVRGYATAGDGTSIVVVRLDGAPVPASTLSALKSAAVNHPAYFADALRGETRVLGGKVRLSREGVFEGDRKVVDLDSIVRTMDQAEITQIAVTEKKSSLVWTIAGAAIGAGFGMLTAFGIANSQCGASCSDETALMAVMGFGLPVAGGFIGWGATRHPVNRVLYTAP